MPRGCIACGIWGRDQPSIPAACSRFSSLQVLRVWVLMTLGSRWTTRIIVFPARRWCSRDPIAILSHPNYLVVVGEIAVCRSSSLCLWLALVFSVLNAAVLRIRIRAENTALAGSRGWLAARSERDRELPKPTRRRTGSASR